MQCIINQLTNFDETKKRARNSQTVRAKENLQLSHGGLSLKRQTLASRLM